MRTTSSGARSGSTLGTCWPPPILEIPQTLNWKPPTTLTDHLGGSLLLIYKLLVIIPLISLVVGLVTVLRTPRESGN